MKNSVIWDKDGNASFVPDENGIWDISFEADGKRTINTDGRSQSELDGLKLALIFEKRHSPTRDELEVVNCENISTLLNMFVEWLEKRPPEPKVTINEFSAYLADFFIVTRRHE